MLFTLFLVGATLFLIFRGFQGSSENNNASLDLDFASFEGIVLHSKWWPRTRNIGEEEFQILTKDPNMVTQGPVYLERWWHRDSMGDLYFLVLNDGKPVDEGGQNIDKLFMTRKFAHANDEGRLFVKWSTSKKPCETDRNNVWEMTLEIHELTMKYPFQRTKGEPWYLHKNSWNAIIRKTTDAEEITAAIEAKFMKNQKGNNS
jgi:hypothetical protein